MKHLLKSNSFQSGFSAIGILFLIIFILVGGFIAFDFGYISYTEKQNIYPTPTPFPGQTQTLQVARGSFSKDKYNVNLTLNFALEGGAVTGEFSGDCSGKITGTYDGKDGGIISGKAFGSCSPLLVPIPASATFTGTVSHQQKNIPITGTGTAVGISGTGSLVLTF